MHLIESLENSLRSRQLLPPGGRLLVAVSGGLDSMVLIHLLQRLAPRFSWELHVAHFDHRLRGNESAGDEQFVREQAASLGVPFHSGAGEVREAARREGISIEMAARQLRHEFLARCAEAVGSERVVLAHHAGDQVETFWLQLLRGSVGEGLGGMKWISRSPARPGVLLVRPLLEVAKAELEAFAAAERIAFREDATNHETDFLRNRVRLELLPLLARKYQPAIMQTTPRLMEVLRAEKEWLALQAEEWLRQPQQSFPELHAALQRAILHIQLRQQGIRPDFELVERLRLNSGLPVTVRLREQVIRGDDGRLRVEPDPNREFQTESLDLPLGNAGTVSWGGLHLSWEMREQAQVGAVPGTEFFDADSVGPKIRLRHWRPADRFQPIGMSTASKLQDIFTNLKISPDARRSLVLAETSQGEIFWVEGLRIAAVARVTPASKRFLCWQWQPDEPPYEAQSVEHPSAL